MSARGRALFEHYAASHLVGPLANAISIQSHAHNFRSHCKEAGIDVKEVTDEVGDLMVAFAAARDEP